MLGIPSQKIVPQGSSGHEAALRRLMARLAPHAASTDVERDISSFVQLRKAVLQAIDNGPSDLGTNN